jgi:hypothetical protein
MERFIMVFLPIRMVESGRSAWGREAGRGRGRSSAGGSWRAKRSARAVVWHRGVPLLHCVCPLLSAAKDPSDGAFGRPHRPVHVCWHRKG